MKRKEAIKQVDLLMEYALQTNQVFMIPYLSGIRTTLKKVKKIPKGDW